MQPIVLLAVDKDTSLASFASVLSSILAYEVISCNVHDAIASSTIYPLDIAIVDMSPGMPARYLIQKLKASHPTVPIVAIINYGDIGITEDILALGVDDFLSQPVPLERLRTTLKNAMRLRSLQRNLPMSAELAPDMRANFKKANGDLKTLYEIEREAIANSIEHCQGCITQAAKSLRIGRSTLYRKIQEMNLENYYISRANQMTRPMSVTSLMERS